MKRRFLLISMCAAVMFFSSCSKEDNETVDTKEVNNQTEVNATKAITVSAKQKSSVSKVALGGKDGDKYKEVFSEGEVLKLYLNGDEIASLDLTDGADKTTATFYGEIPLSADGKTISAKILPKESPSGLAECSSFAAAVSTYASLYGTFTYNASADNFDVTLYDEVSYFVVETNKFSEVDINGNNYTVSNNSVVFAFKENQTVSSTALELNSVALTAGGNVYFKTVNSILVTSITLNKTATEITVGGTETLTATISPANATDNSVTWTSTNTSVATVDANGEVTAVSAGTTTIKATANDGSGVFGSCAVTVKVPSETFNTNQSQTNYEGTHISITGTDAGDDDGIQIGKNNSLTITAKNDKKITKVELHLSSGAGWFGNSTTVSSGTIVNLTNKNYSISNVNATSLTMSNSANAWVQIDQITVYYE